MVRARLRRGALLQLGTLAGLAASLTVGVFGFKESLDAPLLPQSVVVELIGAGVLLVGVWAGRASAVAAAASPPGAW